ncbi:anthranilate synthase component 1 [Buchnera aphidicola]|uniref:anthranilate synthase component 1 n=1 Tax=Buchnera aphidicola TaxID=9 RepID=UPI002237A403|nr:anthranilate synthase component 1 [Buchnera aphidicola]MCW5197443.1 anthranilate synthase component 1 [Buchnera aphidicola (Chaitophorus viminalis)]
MKNRKLKIKVIQKKSHYYYNPLKIFNHICQNNKNTLLLESANINDKKNLKSIIIVDSALRISLLKNIVYIKPLTQNGSNLVKYLELIIPNYIQKKKKSNILKLIFPNLLTKNIDEDSKLKQKSVFDIFRIIINSIQKIKKFPKSIFFGGLFSYDLISYFELLPKVKKIQKCPDFCFYLSETMIFINHLKKKCTIQSTIFNKNIHEVNKIKKRIKNIKNIINKKKFKSIKYKKNNSTIKCNKNDIQFSKIIQNIKKYIKNGDIFQIVPSRKFYMQCLSPLYSYQNLKKRNPSPYMFFMQDQDFTLFGASPESFLKYNSNNRKIEIHPIAGTKPRGKFKNGNINYDLDSKIELEMKTNKKELSEHIMLVDLARNDLSRICKTGSRYVKKLIKVEKYSHVMHLVSIITGILKKKLDILHAYRACMNMGTLTGAPKIQAMKLISKIEKETRGSYGGSIGYFTGEKKFNTCIIIRSAYIENDIATIQVGAGIVLKSIPKEECLETWNKAYAVIKSIRDTKLIRKI